MAEAYLRNCKIN